MLRRLEVGLVDEGVKVVRAIPEGCSLEPTTGLAGELTYADDAWRLLGLSPSRVLARRLDALDTLGPARDDEAIIDVVHIFGTRAWTLGLQLADALGACPLLELWSGEALARVDSVERRWAARFESAGVAGMWMCPDAAMAAAISRAPRAWAHRLSAWGVHVPTEVRPGGSDECIGLSILASGADAAALAPMLAGLARATAGRDDVMAFLEAEALRRRPELWKRIVGLDLSSRLSAIPETECRRQLVLRSDVLVCPERLGEHRTLLLEAMAIGMTVICRDDPLVEATQKRGPAMIVEKHTEDGWERAFRAVIEAADHGRSIGLAARTYIQGSRLAHGQVKAALDAYAAMVAEPIPIR